MKFTSSVYQEELVPLRVEESMRYGFNRTEAIPDERNMIFEPSGAMGGDGTAICVILDIETTGDVDNDCNCALMNSAVREIVNLLATAEPCVDVSVCGNIITAVFDTVFKCACTVVVRYMSMIYSLMAIVNMEARKWLGGSGKILCRIGADIGHVTASFATDDPVNKRTMMYFGSALNGAIALAQKPSDSAKVLRISKSVYDNIEDDMRMTKIVNYRDYFTMNGKFYDSYLSDSDLNDVLERVNAELGINN